MAPISPFWVACPSQSQSLTVVGGKHRWASSRPRVPVLEPGTVSLISNPWPQKEEGDAGCPRRSSYLGECDRSREGHVAGRGPRGAIRKERRTFWEAFWFPRRLALPYPSGHCQDRDLLHLDAHAPIPGLTDVVLPRGTTVKGLPRAHLALRVPRYPRMQGS